MDATPRWLLEQARALVEARASRPDLARTSPGTAGAWPRAAALLARQALEAAMRLASRHRNTALGECSARAQLLCLPLVLADDDLARQTAHAWWALSRATHHHPYELAPTAGEIEALFDQVQQLVDRVG